MLATDKFPWDILKNQSYQKLVRVLETKVHPAIFGSISSLNNRTIQILCPVLVIYWKRGCHDKIGVKHKRESYIRCEAYNVKHSVLVFNLQGSELDRMEQITNRVSITNLPLEEEADPKSKVANGPLPKGLRICEP